MKYPTMDDVEKASRTQLCSWHRFLESPGASATGDDDFQTVMEAQGLIMDRIQARLKELGGFTPEISKAIGWGNFK